MRRLPYFNSTMVQLIDHPPIYLNPVTPYFNSTMVQLIGDTECFS